MGEWKEVRLSEVTSILGDGIHGTPVYSEQGDYYFINGNNLCEGRIVLKPDTKRVSEEEYHKHKKELNSRTLLFSINGTVGNVAKYNGEPCILGKSACYFNVINTVDKDFIYYVISSPSFVKSMSNLANGTTIKNVSLKQMRDKTFLLPSFETQRSIASILSSLDSKIENNRKICANLEAQAQALFKHWFIDFAPFKDGKFVESELGMIPEGWRVGKLGELPLYISDYVANGSFASLRENVSLYNEENYAYFIRNTDLKEKRFKVYVDKKSYDFLSKSVLHGGEIIISNVGDVGSVHLCPVLDKPMTLGNNIIMIKSGNIALQNYLYILFKYSYGQGLIHSITGGTAQPKFNKTDFKSLKIAVPSEKSLQEFNDFIKNLLQTIQLKDSENNHLSEIRDSILPKLMSGEIKV